MKNFSILLFLIVPLLFSCRDDEQIKPHKSNPIILLNNKRVFDNVLGISFKVPKNWEKMPAALSEKYVARISTSKENDFILYTPKYFFYNKTNSALLRVGSVSSSKELEREKLSPQFYAKLFKKYNGDLLINQKTISIKGRNVIELLIEKGNLLSFKYILTNSKREIIQLDFSISKKDFKVMKPFIDASIQSISFL